MIRRTRRTAVSTRAASWESRKIVPTYFSADQLSSQVSSTRRYTASVTSPYPSTPASQTSRWNTGSESMCSAERTLLRQRHQGMSLSGMPPMVDERRPRREEGTEPCCTPSIVRSPAGRSDRPLQFTFSSPFVEQRSLRRYPGGGSVFDHDRLATFLLPPPLQDP